MVDSLTGGISHGLPLLQGAEEQRPLRHELWRVEKAAEDSGTCREAMRGTKGKIRQILELGNLRERDGES